MAWACRPQRQSQQSHHEHAQTSESGESVPLAPTRAVPRHPATNRAATTIPARSQRQLELERMDKATLVQLLLDAEFGQQQSMGAIKKPVVAQAVSMPHKRPRRAVESGEHMHDGDCVVNTTVRVAKKISHERAPKTAAAVAQCSRGTSRFNGVNWNKRMQKWVARVKTLGVAEAVHLGSFSEEEEAARAHDAAARTIRGENAHGGRNPNCIGRTARRWSRLNFPTVEEEKRLAAELQADAQVSLRPPTSCFCGVTFHPNQRKFQAVLTNGGVRHHCGSFETEQREQILTIVSCHIGHSAK